MFVCGVHNFSNEVPFFPLKPSFFELSDQEKSNPNRGCIVKSNMTQKKYECSINIGKNAQLY